MPAPTASLRSSVLTPGYRYSERAGRYVAANGRFVNRAAVRAELDRTLDNASKALKAITQQYRDGAINVLEWREAMAAQIKTVHLAAAAAAKGGWAEMSQADYGRVGQQLRKQYEYLDRFAWQVASGEQKPDGTMLRRAAMYGQAGRQTFHETERREQATRGFDEERRVRHAKDSCDDCIEYAALGWQPTGTLPPIGESQCRTYCLCTFEYRNTATEAVA